MILAVGVPFLKITNKAIKQRLENTADTVLERVRRTSRNLSIGLQGEGTTITDDGSPTVEKSLVEPLNGNDPNHNSSSNNNNHQQVEDSSDPLAVNPADKNKKSCWSGERWFHYALKGSVQLGLITVDYKRASSSSNNGQESNNHHLIGNNGSGKNSFGAFSPVAAPRVMEGRQD